MTEGISGSQQSSVAYNPHRHHHRMPRLHDCVETWIGVIVLFVARAPGWCYLARPELVGGQVGANPKDDHWKLAVVSLWKHHRGQRV